MVGRRSRRLGRSRGGRWRGLFKPRFSDRGFFNRWRHRGERRFVVFFVVVISLTMGTLGGYALARSGYRYTFWLLMAALVFRAMPHVSLVSGYLLPFFQMNVWGILPTTIIVRVRRSMVYPSTRMTDAACSTMLP